MSSTGPSGVEQVRSFNRTVALVIGALDARFLGRDRPMAQSRLLWEVGEGGVEIRELRLRLGLDAGYVSRLLRSLKAEGLVEIAALPAGDRRIRTIRLTEAGRIERRELDRLSDELAAGLLAPLDEAERGRLTSAMREVERLLLRARTTIAPEAAASADVRWCFSRYFAELNERFEQGYDASKANTIGVSELTPPAGLVLIARLGQGPVGCGALRFLSDDTAYIKRLWVAPRVRGTGLGGRLLRELERHARERHATRVQLETHRSLVEAIAMYRRAGYVEVTPFNTEPYADHWFEKRLVAG